MWGERSKDEKAAQIIERLEADGLANVMDYKFDTAKIAEVPEDHWAHGTWRWALTMEPMDHEAPEVFVGSPWPVEDCLAAHTWEVVDHISDSTIVPFVIKNRQSLTDFVKGEDNGKDI